MNIEDTFRAMAALLLEHADYLESSVGPVVEPEPDEPEPDEPEPYTTAKLVRGDSTIASIEAVVTWTHENPKPNTRTDVYVNGDDQGPSLAPPIVSLKLTKARLKPGSLAVVELYEIDTSVKGSNGMKLADSHTFTVTGPDPGPDPDPDPDPGTDTDKKTTVFEGNTAPPIIQRPIIVNLADVPLGDWPSSGFHAGGNNVIQRLHGSSKYDRDIRVLGQDVERSEKPLSIDGYRFIELVGVTIKPEKIADGRIGEKRLVNDGQKQEMKDRYPWPKFKNVHHRVPMNAALRTQSTHGAVTIGCDLDLEGSEGDCHIFNPAPRKIQSAASSRANFNLWVLLSRIVPGRGTIASIHSDGGQNQVYERSGSGVYISQCDLVTPYSGWTIQPFGGLWGTIEVIDVYADFHPEFWFSPSRKEISERLGVYAGTGAVWDKDVRPSHNGGPNMTGRAESIVIDKIIYRAPRDAYKSFASVSVGGYEPQIYVCAKYDIEGNRVQQRKLQAQGGQFVDGPLCEWSNGLTLLPGTMDDKGPFLEGKWKSVVQSLLKAPPEKIGPNFRL